MTDLWDFAEEDHPARSNEYTMGDLGRTAAWALCLRPKWVCPSNAEEEVIDAELRHTRYACRRVLDGAPAHKWDRHDHPYFEERERESAEEQLALGEVARRAES